MIAAARLREIEALTFDCYGTLIDWETGILEALRPILSAHGRTLEDRAILELYAELEAETEAGPYRPYREVLSLVAEGLGRRLDFSPSPQERGRLAESLPAWRPFPDTCDALRRLSRRFRLGVISNVDADLFEGSARQLGLRPEWAVLAEQVGAYKPSGRNFVAAIEATGLPSNRLLHCAQSLYHDIVPAKVLGLATVWVNRRAGQDGFGATPPAEAAADLVVPDLKSLADALSC